MAAITARPSSIHGQLGVEDEAVGSTDGELVVGVVALVVLAAWVGVGDAVDVDVDFGDEVGDFVGGGVVLVVVEVWIGDRLLAGASVVGAAVGAPEVRDAIGVRDGRVGAVNDREALGRFEPPPQEEARPSAITKTETENPPVLRTTIARRRGEFRVTSLRPRVVNRFAYSLASVTPTACETSTSRYRALIVS